MTPSVHWLFARRRGGAFADFNLGAVQGDPNAADRRLTWKEILEKGLAAQLAGRLTGLVLTVAATVAGNAELALALGLVASFLVEAVVDRVFPFADVAEAYTALAEGGAAGKIVLAIGE